MAGEFAQLLPFTWRGLHLPITRIEISIAHDLVEHKYWGVDGARVEATGRAPTRISAVIPISNSIVPGKSEKWQAGVLYPEALRKFMVAFADRSTGLLQHPEIGELVCKPDRYTFELDGSKQDSTEIHASWIETIDDLLRTEQIDSPVQAIEIALQDLDASGVDLKELVPTLPEFKDDIESLGRRLTSFLDAGAALSYRAVGVVNRILYQAHRIEVSIQRQASLDALNPVTPLRPFIGKKSHAVTWPAMNALQRIQAAAYTIRKRLLSKGGVGFYVVPAETTFAGLVVSLPPKTSIATLLSLNPNLARGPVVLKGTIVRYPLFQ